MGMVHRQRRDPVATADPARFERLRQPPRMNQVTVRSGRALAPPGAGQGRSDSAIDALVSEGFARVRVNGEFYTLDDVPTLDKNKKHSIDLVVDRLVNKEGIRGRLADSVELALR